MIKGVSFVGIAVKDVEGATRLYAEMFGPEPWDQGVMDMPGAKAIMLPLGGCSIELLQPTASQDDTVGGDLARWLDKRGEGFCRLGLWVDDLDGETRRLKDAGVHVIGTGEYGRIGEELGARMAFVHPRSTFGVLIELDQQM